MAFNYFQFKDQKGISRDGVFDEKKRVKFLYIASRPEAPLEFKLITPEWEIPVFLKDATVKVENQKRDVVWQVERVCLWKDNENLADSIRTLLFEAIAAYSGHYRPEKIQTIRPSFENTIWN